MLSLFEIFSSKALDFKDEKRPYGTQCLFLVALIGWVDADFHGKILG